MKKVLRPIGLILLSGTLCSTGQVFATDVKSEAVANIAQQKKQVTGTVIDAFGPVAGASVSVKGTSEGTITDMDGNFSIDVTPGSTLSISFIGYVTQEIKYTGQASLHVTLVEDTQKIDEVVVTAMGIKKEKRALPYAMSELKAEQIQTVPVQNVATSLYGKAAGVQIQQTAMGPTGGTKIQIRGINSVEGNTRPLIVVDGIPINDTDSQWSGRERNEIQQGSALNDINPDDIETMSILKGANAAALYGSRATNGVIVITTKRGSAGKGLGIQVSTSYMYDQRAYMPEFQNVFGGGSNPYFTTNADGQYIYNGDTYRSFGPHTVLSPVAFLSGIDIVRDACQDEVIGKYIRKVMFEELMETLNLPKAELEKFANDVLERFNNPFVDHQVTSIMLNSFPKFQTRDLPGLKEYLKRKGKLPEGLVLGLAAILTYYKGGNRADGTAIVPNDDPKNISLMKTLWATGSTREVAGKILTAEDIWGENLNEIPGLADKIVYYLDAIQEKGMREVVKEILR